MDQRELEVDLDLVAKFGRSATRYTSYPTADHFVDTSDSRTYARWAAHRDTRVCRPLALCLRLDSSNGLGYLNHLHREIALQAPLFRDDTRVEQMYWSSGRRAIYPTDDLAALFQSLRTHFLLAPEGDYSIDVDLGTIDTQAILELRAIGFNRLRIGVQDFAGVSPSTLQQVHRTEPVSALIAAARDAGFESIDMDLLFGRPRQSLKRFTSCVEQAVALRPDRIAVSDWDRSPASAKSLRQVRGCGPGSRSSHLKLLASAAERLMASGYAYIGMDQFALPADSLAVAQREGRLHWNCQGYTTHADCDMVGLGTSAIGAIGPTYSENAGTIPDYYARLDGNQLPIVRGIQLTRDDLVRRNVIQRLLCHFEVSKEAVGINYLIDFDRYFAAELEALRAFQQHGLIEMEPDWICVTPRGRLLVSTICMAFDRYQRQN